jgi:hypothetical protein
MRLSHVISIVCRFLRSFSHIPHLQEIEPSSIFPSLVDSILNVEHYQIPVTFQKSPIFST